MGLSDNRGLLNLSGSLFSVLKMVWEVYPNTNISTYPGFGEVFLNPMIYIYIVVQILIYTYICIYKYTHIHI